MITSTTESCPQLPISGVLSAVAVITNDVMRDICGDEDPTLLSQYHNTERPHCTEASLLPCKGKW